MINDQAGYLSTTGRQPGKANWATGQMSNWDRKNKSTRAYLKNGPTGKKNGPTGKTCRPFVNAWTGSDSIAQKFEYHFFDQRFALVLLERVLVLPNHGIHCFFFDFIWIMVENSTRKGVSSRRVEQAKHWTN